MDKADKADRAHTRTVAGSISGAFGALFMIGAIAFGATAIRPMTADSPDPVAMTGQEGRADQDGDQAEPDQTGNAGEGDDQYAEPKQGDEHEFRQEPKDEPKEEPKDEPAEEPKDEPKEEPKDEPAEEPKDEPKEEPKDEPKPDTTHLELGAWVKEGKVKLEWSKFRGDGFAYYKVVRSTDEHVAWPLGENDMLVAAVSDRYTTYGHDKAPCGDEFHYRVFAVKHSESGYAVLAASNVAGAFVECQEEPEPDPEPVHMGFELEQTDHGVLLAWEQCTSDGFVYYRVVRSATNENPTYPLNDGTELLAAIGDSEVTTFVDESVAPGQTWFYRVLSLAETDHGWVVVGETSALSITVA